MKKILFLFACGLQILVAEAQTSDRNLYMQKSFPRASVKQIEAETSGGNISVSGETSGEARVEVWIRPNNGRDRELSKEEIANRLTEFDLIVDLQGDKIRAIARRKGKFNDGNNSLSISFRIYTPAAVGTSLRTSGGNIDLKNLSGTEDFRTSGGNLDIEQLSGKILGRTSGGNVSIKDSKENIDLHTSGGNMLAERCEGMIRMETSGGNMSLRSVKGDIHASTSGGQVEGGDIAGELRTSTSGGNIDLEDLTCSLDASTSGGNIHVSIKTTNKYISLSNSSGDISLQLPQDKGLDLKVSGDRVHSTTMHNFQGDVDERHITGSLNGGGVPVKVDGNSGTVHLSFR
jgi:DUF4097 and DUF4098 domain-containing protein YvlB